MPIIKVDSRMGNELGFTSDKFDSCSYLSYIKRKNEIWISFIMSKEEGKGYLRSLFDNIESKGYKIIVPTPFYRMKMICTKRGMVSREIIQDNQLIEIMIKP